MSVLFWLAVLLLAIVALFKIPGIRHRYFARFMTWLMKSYNISTCDLKASLFKDFEDHKEGIRILEIGVGAGSNLKYYPANSKLVAVDPNKFFKPYLLEQLQTYPHVTLENFIITPGEDLSSVDSNSFDYVVTTIVLCSVENVRQVLKEIHRVLKPGGKHYYLEHILDTKGTLLNIIQQGLTQLGIWPLFFDGCQLNRSIDEDVLTTGFKEVDQKKVMISGSVITQLIKPHIMGIATK